MALTEKQTFVKLLCKRCHSSRTWLLLAKLFLLAWKLEDDEDTVFWKCPDDEDEVRSFWRCAEDDVEE